MYEFMNEWKMNEWMKKMNEWMNRWMAERMNERINEWRNGWMKELMDERIKENIRRQTQEQGGKRNTVTPRSDGPEINKILPVTDINYCFLHNFSF